MHDRQQQFLLCMWCHFIPGTDEGGNGPAKVRPNDYIAITARIPTQTDLNLGFFKKGYIQQVKESQIEKDRLLSNNPWAGFMWPLE